MQDGVNYVQNGWIVGTSQSFCLIEQSWIHKMYYMNDWDGEPNKHLTHNDVFQTNNGKNITIRWSMLGGNRVQSGYDRWPNGANEGDDAYSSILQLQQEVSDSQVNRVENLLVEENWVWGGTMGINCSFKSAYPSNTGSTWTIRNNRFYTRGANWSNCANNPYEADNNWSVYLAKSTSSAATITGNTQNDPTTGASLGAVTISPQPDV